MTEMVCPKLNFITISRDAWWCLYGASVANEDVEAVDKKEEILCSDLHFFQRCVIAS